MSRTLLWIMTVFLSLAMLALVAIQAYWIRHSVRSEENQLRLTVHQALNEISDELVRSETAINILKEIQPPIIQHHSTAVWNFRIDARSNLSADSDAFQLDEEYYMYSTSPPPLKNQKVELIDDSILVILGEDESQEDTILISAMRPEQVRSELEKNWAEQEMFLDKIVRRMILEDQDITERISGTRIESLLREKLGEKGLDMPFEYAVYHEGETPIFHSDNFSEYEDYQYFRASLFPGGLYNKPTLISVYFPTEKEHFRKSMGLIGGSSLLITLMLLMLFSLALFIIFKQKRLSEMKNDFVNNMTHELKTPISTISLASQMLSDRSIPDEQKNLSQISRIIQTESRQLGYQVERVLQMAIFDHGQLKLKLQEIDLNDLIETVAQNFLLQVDKRQGKLEFLPEAEDAVIAGDTMHMTNVISNLMENAMKYTRRTPVISVTTKNEDGQLVVSVTDNGIGISKEDQKRVFDKFYRVPTGNVHNVKGFGLGLSYVKLIVEHHNGTIGVKSEPGKGSRFDIRLPLYKAKNHPHERS
jgi:two-component system phosphate regulon sensor histidine kinase PhoR